MGLNMNNKFPFHSMMQASADRKTSQKQLKIKHFVLTGALLVCNSMSLQIVF